MEIPFVSIIIPVKNEAAILSRCLESIKNLDYPPQRLEVIIADGLSTDNTKEIALGYKAKVVDNQRQIVVSGRNLGFKHAKGDFVAFTDADCVMDRYWLKNSLKYFKDEKVAGVGGLTLIPQDSSHFEKAINSLFYIVGFFSSTSHLQEASSAKEVKDMPGCNAVYRKEILAKAMPVDESLLTAEDVWMNFSLGELGYKFILAPDVVLWHYRRSSVKRFFRQIQRFAVGRLQVGRKNKRLLNFFHIFIGLSIPLILAGISFFYLLGRLGLFLKFALILFLLVTLLSWLKLKSLSLAINITFVFIIFIFSWSLGFLKELFFPLRDVRGK